MKASETNSKIYSEMTTRYDYTSDDDSDWEPITASDDYSSCSSDDMDDNSSATSCQYPDPRSTYEETSSTTTHSKLQPTKLSQTSHKNSWRSFTLAAVLLSLLCALFASFPTADFGDGEESIYVPGVGFSGFWFTLGRLKSIKDPSSKHFVCFSAGCLGAVTILNDFSVDEMACMAETAQHAWRSGEIGRFEVVSRFVDGLVYRNFPGKDDPLNCLGSLHGGRNSTRVPINNGHLMSKLHILTTEKTPDGYGLQAAMRSPTNLNELREMLLQTAWIPAATGDGVMYNGHMDGGFSIWQHPRCTKSVNLPLDAGLILNSLNVNMGRNEAYRLWYDGLAYGL